MISLSLSKIQDNIIDFASLKHNLKKSPLLRLTVNEI